MISIPADWPEDLQLRLYRSAARAERELLKRKAGNVHRAIYWYIFAHVHRLAPAAPHTAAAFAQAAGCGTDYAAECARELRAWGLLIIGRDGRTGRWTTVLIGRDYFVGEVFAYFIHKPSRVVRPQTFVGGGHYKDLPFLPSVEKEDYLYSADADGESAVPVDNPDDGAGNGARRVNGKNGQRPRWAEAGALADRAYWRLKGQLDRRLGRPPPGPS